MTEVEQKLAEAIGRIEALAAEVRGPRGRSLRAVLKRARTVSAGNCGVAKRSVLMELDMIQK